MFFYQIQPGKWQYRDELKEKKLYLELEQYYFYKNNIILLDFGRKSIHMYIRALWREQTHTALYAVCNYKNK